MSTQDASVDEMLATFEDIKAGQDASKPHEADHGTDGCPVCGSTVITRSVSYGSGSNRTANRLVGGRRMRVVRTCQSCGHEWDGEHR